MPPGLREALTEAYDAAAETEAPETAIAEPAAEAPEPEPAPVAGEETVEAAEGAPPETEAEKVQRARDEESGRFVKERKRKAAAAKGSAAAAGGGKAAAAPGDQAAGAKVVPAAGVKPAGAAAAPPVVAEPAVKAPASWKPGAREKWAATPPEVQAEILRVDREVRQVMQEAAPLRQQQAKFQAAIAPYAQMIAAEAGGDPMRAVGSLLQTAAALRTAPEPHKAAMVASMMKTFGISVESLATALDGKAAPGGGQGAQSFDPGQLRAQLKQELLGELEQRDQAQQQQKAQAEAETFLAGKEFGGDVREDMADLLQGAARRNVAMTLEQAYDRACKLNPDVSDTLEKRRAAEAAKAKTASTQQARAASSSVKSQPTGAPVAPKSGNSRREALEEAWDAVEGR